jgi:hypothetical protein
LQRNAGEIHKSAYRQIGRKTLAQVEGKTSHRSGHRGSLGFVG